MAGQTSSRSRLVTILLTLAVAAILGGIAIFVVNDPAREAVTGNGGDTPDIAFPTLRESRNSVAEITIGDAESEAPTVTLRRAQTPQSADKNKDGDGDGGAWSLATMADYPATPGRVRGFLDALAEATLLAPVDPADVPESTTSAPEWRRVTIRDGTGTILVTFDLGPQISTPKASDLTASHIRTGDGNALWLADLVVERAIHDPKDWIDTQLFAFERQRIAEVRTDPAQGQATRIRRVSAQTEQFELVGMDGELRTDEAWKVGDLTVPFADMTFQDAVAAETKAALFDGEWKGFMRTLDGVILRFDIAYAESTAWAWFRVDFAAPELGTVETGMPPAGGLDSAVLRARVTNRAFQLPAHIADRLTRPREAINTDSIRDGSDDSGAPADIEGEAENDTP